MPIDIASANAFLNGAVVAAVDCVAAKTDAQTAKVLVGAVAGLVSAVLVCCAAGCCRLAWLLLRSAGGKRGKSAPPLPRVDEDSECRDPQIEAVTSGGYRSDSSSDDEGHGAQVAKLAQKRAHKSNGV
tara:strand:- start:9753 stop:10136 length:384 start_codon:yes stop_codon:yes gene_type:complete